MTRREALGSASFMQASMREEECANRHASGGESFGNDGGAGDVRGCARAGRAGFEAELPRLGEREPGRLDEGGGDIGFEKGAVLVANRGGSVCDHAGGY